MPSASEKMDAPLSTYAYDDEGRPESAESLRSKSSDSSITKNCVLGLSGVVLTNLSDTSGDTACNNAPPPAHKQPAVPATAQPSLQEDQNLNLWRDLDRFDPFLLRRQPASDDPHPPPDSAVENALRAFPAGLSPQCAAR